VPGRIATILVPAAAVAAAAWWSGAYFPRTWGALLLAEAIVIAAVAILGDRVELDRRAALLVGSLVALALWQAVSRAWSLAPDASILESERTLVYAGAAAAVLLAVPRSRARELVTAVLLGATSVTTGGLAEHVLGSAEPSERFELPIGYANASGILATTTLLLGLGLAADRPGWLAAGGAAAAVPAGAALYLSLSRGAMLAAALGLVVLGLLSRGAPGRLVVVGLPSMAAFVVAVLGTFDREGATESEVATLGALVLLSAVAVALALRAPDLALPRRVVWVTLALAGVALLGLVTWTALNVRETAVPSASQQRPSGRLVSASTSYRGDYWDVAAGMVEDEPLSGTGAGSFERVWLAERPSLLFVRDAHNAYLETLAELGPVGLGLLVLALVVPLLRARRAVESVAGRAALVAYVALLAHAALDWDWELPAVTLCTLLLGVALVRLGEDGRATELTRGRRAVVGAGAASLAAAALVIHAGNVATAQAHEALDRGDAAAARRHAERARRFTPWSAEPLRLLGEADLAAGRLRDARSLLRRSLGRDDRAWESWLALAIASDGEQRVAALRRARALDPLAPELGVVPEG
jgi:O-Antigen ligase